MAYEWLYGNTDSRKELDSEHQIATKELAALFPAYINGLQLKTAEGTVLTADNYLNFIKSELIRSAQIAKNAGAEISEEIGLVFSKFIKFWCSSC